MESQIVITCEDIQGKGNAKLLNFEGDMDATNVESVMEDICKLLNEGYINLVADFKKLRYVNSTGLGILLHCSKSAKEKGGCFKIANINENVYEIIEIIGAISLLEIYDELDEALESLN